MLPKRATPDLTRLSNEESAELWEITNKAVKAITEAYHPDGINVGMNIGKTVGRAFQNIYTFIVFQDGKAIQPFDFAETRMIPETLTSKLQA